MRARDALRAMAREARGARGRLAFFVLCLALGVAAVVGVAGLADALEGGIRAKARELLAADLAVRSRRPLPAELEELTRGVEDLARVDLVDLYTMAGRADGAPGSRLVELRAVDGPHPLHGALELEPERTLGELLTPETCVVAPELLQNLELSVGEELKLGGQAFRIAGVVRDEPDRVELRLSFGPRVFVSAAGLARTPLVTFGSRVRHQALFRLPESFGAQRLAALAGRMQDELPGAAYLRVETWRDAQPALRRGVERVDRYLGLVALLSLVLGGAGVAQIVRTWLAGKQRDVAVLRCLGFRPREIMTLYLGHVTALALAGSLVGCALGACVPLLVPLAASDVLPTALLRPFQPAALARGLALGLGVALVFSLPPLTAIWRVPPARVLRAEVEPLPPPRAVRWAARLALALGVFASAWAQVRELHVAAGFTAGLFALALVLHGGARLVSRLVARLPRERLGPYLAHGMSALARPGAGTTGAIVALGLGVMVVSAMTLVERRLDRELTGSLPDDAPSAFLVDVQPDQWPGVCALLDESGAAAVDSVPVTMARLAQIDGRPVGELAKERRDAGRGRWVLTREQRLTWMEQLPADNVIVAGALWNDPQRSEVSVEERFAEDLGIGVGSVLDFDVQGVPLELAVTSLRSVEWQSFSINFFLVVEPGVLEDAPHFRLAAARLGPEAEDRLQAALVEAYPNVTLLRIRPIVERIAALLERLALAVRVLGIFTVLSGLAILAGSVASTTVRRAGETALLKTLGVTRRGVVALLASEYALAGLVAGALGGSGAWIVSWSFLRGVLELDPDLPLAAPALTALAAALLAAACGIAASGQAIRVRPMDSLRAAGR